MPRARSGERILGPYRHGKRWRVVEVAADGSKSRSHFETKAAAEKYVELLAAHVSSEAHTTETALDEYEVYLRNVKGNKEGSIKHTRWAVETFFGSPQPLWGLNKRACKRFYETMAEKYAADSHRNNLAQAKTFLRWCVEKGWLAENPAEGIQGVGRRARRKKQLRIKDARKWFTVAFDLAEDGDDGAMAALVMAYTGLRSSMVCGLTVGQFDEEEEPCDTLWIDGAKTEAGDRVLAISEEIRPLIVEWCKGKGRGALLFPAKDGKHWRDWPRKQVHRICDAAGVDKITAHALRGMLATLAARGGKLPHDIAADMGHTDPRMTRDAYAQPGSFDEGARKRGLKVVKK